MSDGAWSIPSGKAVYRVPDSQLFDGAVGGHALPPLDERAALDSQAGLVASGVYAAGRRVAAIPVDEAGRWLHEPGHVVWIGLVEPQDELLRRVQAQFGLHDLAIKDAGTSGPSSNGMVTRCSWSRARRRWWTRESRSARPTCS